MLIKAYNTTAVQELLAKLGFMSSMSGKGSCYDHAVIESFWSTLKRECLQGKVFEDAFSIKLATFSYIEGYYNKQRKHATLGYLSPIVFEKKNCSSIFPLFFIQIYHPKYAIFTSFFFSIYTFSSSGYEGNIYVL